MINNLIPAFGAFALVLVSACSDNDLDDNGQNGSLLLGAGGGTVTTLQGPVAGTAIQVPAGAVSQPAFLTIEEGLATPEPGWRVVGPVAALSPQDQVFASPATLQLPFRPNEVPAGLPDSAIYVKIRDGLGSVRTLRAATVDRTGLVMGAPNGVTVPIPTVTVPVSALGTAWVAVPVIDPNQTSIDLRDYLLVDQGDRYEFDNGLVVTAESAGLGGAPALVFDYPGPAVRTESFDFANDGSLSSRGWSGNGFEVTHPAPLRRAPAFPVFLDVFSANGLWELRAPANAAMPSLTGQVFLRGRVDRVDPVEAVRLTGFADVIQLITERRWVLDGLPIEVSETEFVWLSRGVGIVGLEDSMGAQFALQRAVVGGTEIIPQRF